MNTFQSRFLWEVCVHGAQVDVKLLMPAWVCCVHIVGGGLVRHKLFIILMQFYSVIFTGSALPLHRFAANRWRFRRVSCTLCLCTQPGDLSHAFNVCTFCLFFKKRIKLRLGTRIFAPRLCFICTKHDPCRQYWVRVSALHDALRCLSGGSMC